MFNELIKIAKQLANSVEIKAELKAWNELEVREDFYAECPNYMQLVKCHLLIDQYSYGHFNTDFDNECRCFIDRHKALLT